jgi:hypothetical protein
MNRITQLTCHCGKVHIEVERAPLLSAECHCNSCRAAGTRLEAVPVNPRMVEPNGGTRFVLYRKDRVRFTAGLDQLKEFRLKPDSPTRRVIAGCCNTPLFLEFKGGHWLSLYAGLWPADHLPPLDVRTMLGDRQDKPVFDDGVPSGTWPTAKFYALLLSSWIAMGFRVPKIPVTGGEINA